MKYVALLRGINVGGNNLIKMLELKAAFEKSGLTNVSTYIQSGNVLFETNEKSSEKLTKKLESMLSKEFRFTGRVAVKSHEQIKKVLADAPKEWNTRNDLRCYIAFIIDPTTAEEAAKETKVREGVDTLKVGPGALYMTTLMNARTKSQFNKLAGTKVYKAMTIRNYNTTKKILALMESV